MKKYRFFTFLATSSLILCSSCSDDGSVHITPDNSQTCLDDNCNKKDPTNGNSQNGNDNSQNGNDTPVLGYDPAECEGNNCSDEPHECSEDDCKTPETCDTEECKQAQEQCHPCTLNEKKCQNNALMHCREITESDHCTEWQVAETCQPGTYCDESAKICAACIETCPSHPIKCLDNAIAECSSDANGCAVWNITVPCEGNTHCDNSQMKCVPGCIDQCSENERKCLSNAKVQTCQKQENGCYDWITEECGFGRSCSNEHPYCEYLCGDNCDPFSVVILPDTQYYTLDSTETNGGTTAKMMQWIADNKTKYNIKFVMHMGDAANDNKRYQYEIIQKAYKILAQAGIPFSIATGNHEYKQGDSGKTYAARSRSLFSEYINDDFIKSAFQGKDISWFHGFHSKDSMYATFEIGNLKFAVIALEYAPRKDILCWADSLIQNELKDRYIILTTHAYLQSDGQGETYNKDKNKSFSYFNGRTVTRGRHPKSGSPWGHYASYGTSGAEMYKELFARHSNIIMVASGHFCEIAHRDRTGNNGNIFHETVVDYQCEKPCLSSGYEPCCEDKAKQGNGNGWLRLLTIDPKNSIDSNGKLIPNVQAQTFSVLEKYQNQDLMYCSDNTKYGNNKKDASDISDRYSKSSTGPEHKYQFTIDFSNPIQYQYSTNNDLSFGNRNLNSNSDGKQFYPAAAVNRDTGAFVAVWEDDSSKEDGDGNHDIEARFFCPGGCQDRPQFTVNNVTSGQQRKPDIGMDKNGNFVVVWEDDYESDGTYQIYMRGFDNTGNQRIKTTTVNSVAKGQQFVPAIAVAPDGHFVVAWEDYSNGADNPQIYIRGFNADGTELFHDKNTMDTVSGTRREPDIAMAPDGSFVVTWTDDTDGNGLTQIYAKAFNADGSMRLKHFTVNENDAGNQLAPSIGMNSNGDFYIAYDNVESKSVHNIRVRGFDKNKNIIFNDTIVSNNDKLDSTPSPEICLADDRKASIVWKALSTTTDDLEYGDIHFATIDKDGKLSSIKTVNHNVAGIQESPNIACTKSGHSIVVFSDDSDENDYSDLMVSGF